MEISGSSPLSSEEWSRHHNTTQSDQLLSKLKSKDFSVQTLEMLNLTKRGYRILEIGSGSGETSLALQNEGRIATALDFTQSCLDLTESVSRSLNLGVALVLADASKELPFAENQFDVVFQAGLLEHFEREERIKLLRIWGKSAPKMVSIIPNSASVAYRFGMARLKANGHWAYGLELPQYTLQQEFLEAGFRVLEEYTIGLDAALNFLPKWHPARWFMNYLNKKNLSLDNCHQGYLLVTVGEKIE